MIPLQFFLASLVLIFMFGFIPNAQNTIIENLYPFHVYLIIVSTSLLLIFGIYINNRDKSLVSYLKFQFLGITKLKSLLLLYIFSVIISSLLSTMPGYAFLGHPATQMGSIIIIYNILLAYVYYKYADTALTVKFFGFGTILMSILTILESVGFRPLVLWLHSSAAAYPMTTVGIRQHLAGWFSICTLLPIYLISQYKQTFLYWSWLIMGLIGTSLTTSSASTIGVLISLIIWILLADSKINRRYALVTTLLFTASALYLPDAASYTAKQLGRAEANTKDYDSTSTLSTRIILWHAAYRLTLQRPFFGWGDETFAYHAFDVLTNQEAEKLVRLEKGFTDDYTVRTKGFTYIAFKHDFAPNTKERDAQIGSLLYIRPHNVFFDELYSHGIIGFLLLFSVSILYIIKLKSKNISKLPLFLISSLPYIIYLSGWFYVLTVSSLYFIFLGLAAKDNCIHEESL